MNIYIAESVCIRTNGIKVLRAVRVLIFLLPSIEYERAKTRSVRILPFPFHPFAVLSRHVLFCTLPLALYESSPIRFHPIARYSHFRSRLAGLFVLVGADRWIYRNVFSRILSTRVCQSKRASEAKRRSAAGFCD